MASERVVYFGTPDFAVPTLEAVTQQVDVVAVVTQPDRPAGRNRQISPSPVKRCAERLAYPLLQPDRLREIIPALTAMRPTLGILFAYGKMIPAELLGVFPKGILNLHPSLLPRYRGPSPVTQAILDGQKRTGVTIIRLDAQLDHGPIVGQAETEIEPGETAPQLLSRLADIGTKTLLNLLPEYAAGRLSPAPQDERAATITRTVRRDDGRIDWQKSADTIERLSRAYFPWPGVFTTWQGKRLIIEGIKIIPHITTTTPGTILRVGDAVAVACGQHAITLRAVQVEGKTSLPVGDFLRGHAGFIGSVLV
ncbi:MAG: methionyl-tRNA formyltransferase [Patescibacteria group bacterium]|nr:methionyl-tRNA formyltransferase [Patescibacteria group bacterium]